MPAVRSKALTVVTGGLALMVALSVGAAIVSPPAAENLPRSSSFSHQADGAAAAYQTLERAGYPIRRSFDALALLDVDPASTVLVLADPSETPSVSDRRALQTLASAGATVLLAGCDGTAFLNGDAIRGIATFAPVRTFAARFPSPLSSGAPRITMGADCSPPAARHVALYGADENPAVTFDRVGKGLIVWWAGTTPLSNSAIAQAGHLELLLDVVGAPGRTILWDEFYHGQRRSMLSYARATPLPWIGAQLALVLGVAAAMYARRRAPVLDRVAESRASPLEFVDTMAGLYARAGTAGDAIDVARARLRRLLGDATGLAPGSGDDRLSAAAASRLHLDEDDVKVALAGSAPSGDRAGAREALSIVRAVQTCAVALERRGG